MEGNGQIQLLKFPEEVHHNLAEINESSKLSYKALLQKRMKGMSRYTSKITWLVNGQAGGVTDPETSGLSTTSGRHPMSAGIKNKGRSLRMTQSH